MIRLLIADDEKMEREALADIVMRLSLIHI